MIPIAVYFHVTGIENDYFNINLWSEKYHCLKIDRA